MAHKPKADARQADFFGVPVPAPAAPVPRPVDRDKPKPAIKRPALLQNGQRAPERDSLDAPAARPSPAEMNELVANLPDHALAHLVIATVRQLRRRLTRISGHAGKRGTASPLERAARQLVAELGEQGGDDDF